MATCKKQPPKVFYKKTVLKKFANFTGKHLSLLFNKVEGLWSNTLKSFVGNSDEFCEMIRSPFLQNMSGRRTCCYKSTKKIS